MRIAVPDALRMIVGWIVAVRFPWGKVVRSTVVLNLRTGATVMVEVPLMPVLTLTSVGLADRVKSGPTTVIDITTTWNNWPEMPIISAE